MAKDITYQEIIKDVKDGNFAPIYFLMGEEPYYIDRISDYIMDVAQKPEDREFNLTIVYGTQETQIGDVINACKRYPMMAERQVVVLREAQNVKDIEALEFYLQKPMPSTVLIVCMKGKTLDRRKKLAPIIAKVGVLYESKKLYDNQLPDFVKGCCQRRKVQIDAQALNLMCEYVGNDLNRMDGEIEKLALTMPSGRNIIRPEDVEKNIGISKEFNVFELRDALINKDVLKANRIVNYFEANPKSNPLVLTIGALYSYFSNLMVAYYAPQKTEAGIAQFLDIKGAPGQIRYRVEPYLKGMRVFNGVKCMNIIGGLRVTDAKSKGIGNGGASDSDLLRELVYYILH